MLPLFLPMVFSTIQIWDECWLPRLNQSNHHLQRKERQWSEKTIRNEYNTTSPPTSPPTYEKSLTLWTWLTLPQRSSHCRIVQILRVFATAWGFPIQTDTGRGTLD
jgi:hypothetical protein